MREPRAQSNRCVLRKLGYTLLMRLIFAVGLSLLGPCASDPSSQQVADKVDDGGVQLGTDSGHPNAPDAMTTVSTVYAVHAATTDLPAFRVCLDPSSTPLPNDFSHPMPLSNFPGVAPGGMALLGQISGSFAATLVSALEVQNAPGDKTARCGTVTTDGNVSVKPMGSLAFNKGGVEILVISGTDAAPSAKLVTASEVSYDQGALLHLQWGHFAQSLKQAPIAATFGPKNMPTRDALGSVAYGSLSSTAVEASSFYLPTPAPGDYDNFGVQVNGKFYSLSDIQHASDPTTTPGQFFGSRLNGYALLLVDDAGNTQHIVAVPLAP